VADFPPIALYQQQTPSTVRAPARINIQIKDRFGKPVTPREWFLVPLDVVDEIVERIKDGSIARSECDPETATLKLRPE
jgi:hypothetical protein